jgi:type VI secretion system protein ImpK
MNEEQAIGLCRALLIERATDLARSGAYEEAEQALSEAKAADEEDPIVFDLLARIRAQQSRYGEAEVFWKEAARLDPGNAAYRDGLARVRTIQRRPYLPTSWTPIVFGLLVLSLFAVVGAMVWSMNNGEPAAKPVVAEVPATPPAIPPAPVPMQALPKPPNVELTVPGVYVSSERDAVIVKFEQGLFDSGIRLLPEAEKTLKLVAQQLQSQENGLRVNVVGHTNDLPVPPGSPFTDNVDLGLRRAVVVTNLLRKTRSAATHMFAISSQGEANPAYPNDGPENWVKNRTVVVHISNQIP